MNRHQQEFVDSVLGGIYLFHWVIVMGAMFFYPDFCIAWMIFNGIVIFALRYRKLGKTTL